MPGEEGNLSLIGMAELFFWYFTSRTAATDGVVSFGEKETIDCPCEDDSHNNANDDNYKKLYIHISITRVMDKKFLHQ